MKKKLITAAGVAFWLIVWEIAALCVGKEVLLASPISVAVRLFELGNRTLMMDKGRIIQDVSGEKRKGLTIQDLLESFKAGVGKELDNDRMLLST